MKNNELTTEKIKKLAEKFCINLTQTEITNICKNQNLLFNDLENLNSFDITNIKPTHFPVKTCSLLRDDEKICSNKDVLRNSNSIKKIQLHDKEIKYVIIKNEKK